MGAAVAPLAVSATVTTAAAVARHTPPVLLPQEPPVLRLPPVPLPLPLPPPVPVPLLQPVPVPAPLLPPVPVPVPVLPPEPLLPVTVPVPAAHAWTHWEAQLSAADACRLNGGRWRQWPRRGARRAPKRGQSR